MNIKKFVMFTLLSFILLIGVGFSGLFDKKINVLDDLIDQPNKQSIKYDDALAENKIYNPFGVIIWEGTPAFRVPKPADMLCFPFSDCTDKRLTYLYNGDYMIKTATGDNWRKTTYMFSPEISQDSIFYGGNPTKYLLKNKEVNEEGENYIDLIKEKNKVLLGGIDTNRICIIGGWSYSNGYYYGGEKYIGRISSSGRGGLAGFLRGKKKYYAHIPILSQNNVVGDIFYCRTSKDLIQSMRIPESWKDDDFLLYCNDAEGNPLKDVNFDLFNERIPTYKSCVYKNLDKDKTILFGYDLGNKFLEENEGLNIFDPETNTGGLFEGKIIDSANIRSDFIFNGEIENTQSVKSEIVDKIVRATQSCSERDEGKGTYTTVCSPYTDATFSIGDENDLKHRKEIEKEYNSRFDAKLEYLDVSFENQPREICEDSDDSDTFIYSSNCYTVNDIIVHYTISIIGESFLNIRNYTDTKNNKNYYFRYEDTTSFWIFSDSDEEYNFNLNEILNVNGNNNLISKISDLARVILIKKDKNNLILGFDEARNLDGGIKGEIDIKDYSDKTEENKDRMLPIYNIVFFDENGVEKDVSQLCKTRLRHLKNTVGDVKTDYLSDSDEVLCTENVIKINSYAIDGIKYADKDNGGTIESFKVFKNIILEFGKND